MWFFPFPSFQVFFALPSVAANFFRYSLLFVNLKACKSSEIASEQRTGILQIFSVPLKPCLWCWKRLLIENASFRYHYSSNLPENHYSSNVSRNINQLEPGAIPDYEIPLVGFFAPLFREPVEKLFQLFLTVNGRQVQQWHTSEITKLVMRALALITLAGVGLG